MKPTHPKKNSRPPPRSNPKRSSGKRRGGMTIWSGLARSPTPAAALLQIGKNDFGLVVGLGNPRKLQPPQ